MPSHFLLQCEAIYDSCHKSSEKLLIFVDQPNLNDNLCQRLTSFT